MDSISRHITKLQCLIVRKCILAGEAYRVKVEGDTEWIIEMSLFNMVCDTNSLHC